MKEIIHRIMTNKSCVGLMEQIDLERVKIFIIKLFFIEKTI